MTDIADRPSEVRDDRGRLVYADRSNHGRFLAEAFPGPGRGVPRGGQGSVTPNTSVAMNGDWVHIESPYSVPGGRS